MNDPIVNQLAIMVTLSALIVFIGVGTAYLPQGFQWFWSIVNSFKVILKYPFTLPSFIYTKYQMYKLKKEVKQIKVIPLKDLYK